jgi:formylglycine-generating enzyme required for sulfatase activity
MLAAGFAFTGCSDGSGETDGVTGVTLNKGEIYLAVNKTETLTATVQPGNAPDKTVTWSSSKTSVATVSGGTITTVAEGTAMITVTTKNGRTANCLVFVGADVESVSLNKSTLTLRTGKAETLTVTVMPENAGDKTVTWSSSAPTVAGVVNGTVTALAVGTATITATSTSDNTKDSTCVVTVKEPMPPIEGMEWIESGTFMMGSPVTEPGSFDDEYPHQVTLTQGFYMGKYEVTQGQFKELMGYNPGYFYNEGQSEGYYDDGYYEEGWKDYPVDSVTWYDAVEFCNKLSEQKGLEPAYTITGRTPATGSITGATGTINWAASGYRLPTEAEWEYACRAGTTTPFNTGAGITSGLDGQANFDGEWLPYNGAPAGDNLEYPTPVGSYAPNAWGLYDMHGNIGEWCWDWYASYRRTATGASPETDPKGSESGYNRVLRGGSWWHPGAGIRSACRDNFGPGTISNVSVFNGFRVVLP